MPKVAMTIGTDPMKECLDQLVPLLEARLATEEGRDELEAWLEWALEEGGRRLSES